MTDSIRSATLPHNSVFTERPQTPTLVRERFPTVARRLVQTSYKGKHSAHSEIEVKDRLRPILREHFIVREEVTGVAEDGQKNRIDFLCFPKPKTIDLGWDPRWCGIEAKGYGDSDGHTRTATRLIHQAIVYKRTRYPTEGSKTEYPDTVLVYPSLDLIFESASPEVLMKAFDEGIRFGLAKLAAMSRVGELVLTKGTEFEVYFHGINKRFSTRYGKSKFDCLGKEDLHASR